jgi:selenocysteine-specific elongation factor
MPGDRYILREMGRDQTLGGGEILDVDPVRPASRASPSVSVDRVIAERGWIEPEQLERLTGQRRPANAGRWIVSPAARAAVTARLRAACETAGAAGVDVASLADLDRAVLNAGVDGLAVADRRVFCESMRPAGLSARASAVLVQLERSPWSPPEIPREDRGALRELERAGLAVQAGELWFATSAVQAATVLLEGLLSDTPDGFTVAQAREVLGSSRKYTLPLLAHLDAAGVTRRRGDLRIAGPRLKAAGRG